MPKRMTRAQALAQAQALWGESAFVEHYRTGSTREQREAAHARLLALRESGDYIPYSERQQLTSTALSWRYQVGHMTSYGFGMIRGQGDSWEDAFNNAKHR